MFIKFNSVNYFIVPDGKTVSQIYYEVLTRIKDNKISNADKRYLLSKIKEQVNNLNV